jgi:hypothetical protein
LSRPGCTIPIQGKRGKREKKEEKGKDSENVFEGYDCGVCTSKIFLGELNANLIRQKSSYFPS